MERKEQSEAELILPLTKLLPGVFVVSSACPLFVRWWKRGWQGDPVAKVIAEEYLKEMKEQNIDTLVLGCTHYPLLSKTIQQVMGEEVTLVDSAMAVAEYLSRYLVDENDGQKGRDSFM